MARKKSGAPRKATGRAKPKTDPAQEALLLAVRLENEMAALRVAIGEVAQMLGGVSVSAMNGCVDALNRKVAKLEAAAPAQVVANEVLQALIRGAAAVLSAAPEFQEKLSELLVGAIQGDVVKKIERDCENRVGPTIQVKADALIEKKVYAALSEFNITAYLDGHIDRLVSGAIARLDANGRRINEAIRERSESAINGYIEKRQTEAEQD